MTSFFPTKIDITPRDVTCFIFAAAVHSLLFLWQGGMLNLPEQQSVGDMLVNVNFMNDVPGYDLPGGGGGAPKPQGLLARMKSMLKGQGSTAEKSKAPTGETESTAWMKTEQLTDKTFDAKKGFAGLKEKVDNLDIAKGENQELVVKPSQGNFKSAEPNLKENKFKIAKNDVPFPILKPKTQDALANINAIPVVVGKTTSDKIKSLDGGPGDGPALQSKTFAAKGTSAAGTFGSFSKSVGGSSSGGAGTGQLAMGGAGTGSGIVGEGGGAGGGGYSGSGYGTGGSGGGRGGGNGTGVGDGSGAGSGRGGRSWGGGGLGSTEMQALSRRGVPSDSGPAGVKNSAAKHGGFTITGALANRPIQQKVLPPYEMDARVALRFRVDWSGKVLDGIVVEISSGSPTFDQKVISALKQWMFSRLSANQTNEVQEGLIAFVFKGV